MSLSERNPRKRRVREWVIYREFLTRQVFTGIKAETREEAIEEWHKGAGDLQQEREQHLTKLDAVDVRE